MRFLKKRFLIVLSIIILFLIVALLISFNNYKQKKPEHKITNSSPKISSQENMTELNVRKIINQETVSVIQAPSKQSNRKPTSSNKKNKYEPLVFQEHIIHYEENPWRIVDNLLAIEKRKLNDLPLGSRQELGPFVIIPKDQSIQILNNDLNKVVYSERFKSFGILTKTLIIHFRESVDPLDYVHKYRMNLINYRSHLNLGFFSVDNYVDLFETITLLEQDPLIKNVKPEILFRFKKRN